MLCGCTKISSSKILSVTFFIEHHPVPGLVLGAGDGGVAKQTWPLPLSAVSGADGHQQIKVH